jgi:hypothetical protein
VPVVDASEPYLFFKGTFEFPFSLTTERREVFSLAVILMF